MELYQLVRVLLRDGAHAFSRNKNFDAYEDATVRRARRIARHLRSLERDLLAMDPTRHTLEVRDDPARNRVMIRIATRARGPARTSFLPTREWALLLERREITRALNHAMSHRPAPAQPTPTDPQTVSQRIPQANEHT